MRSQNSVENIPVIEPQLYASVWKLFAAKWVLEHLGHLKNGKKREHCTLCEAIIVYSGGSWVPLFGVFKLHMLSLLVKGVCFFTVQVTCTVCVLASTQTRRAQLLDIVEINQGTEWGSVKTVA